MNYHVISVSIFFSFACIQAAAAEAPKKYFYHGLDFGSEAMYNPVSLVINAGYDVLQASTHTRSLRTIPYGVGAKNVWKSISNPFPQIRQFGWSNFIGQEIIPTSLEIEKAQWVPNYTLHLIGGGASYRATREWYEHHDYSAPAAWAIGTTAAYHYLNEIVENDIYEGPNVDAIADMLIFDPAGIILFMSDDVSEFFSETLHLTEWSGQPAISPKFGTLENHGQNYVMRYRLSFLSSTSVFYHFGDSGMLGLSFHQENGGSVSVSGGIATREIRHINTDTGARYGTVDMGWIAGIFYDRDNSLLASLIASNRINEKVKANIYPGVIKIGSVSPGLFCSLGMNDQFVFGVTVQYSPVGLAVRNKE